MPGKNKPSYDRFNGVRDLLSTRIEVGVGLLVGISLVGILGYRLLVPTDWLTAAYYTVCILTTLGLPDEPQSQVIKLFTLVLAISGIGFYLYAITVIAQFIIAGQFQRLLGRRRVISRMKHLQNHFIICGYGRIGRKVGAQLQAQKLPFVIIDRNETIIAQVEEAGLLGILGDASHEDTLERVGIDRARVLIVATPSDAENLLITMTARQLNPSCPIIVRCADEINASKLTRGGASRVVTPFTTGASQIALAATKPNVIDLIDLATGVGDREFQISELQIGVRTPVAGQSLKEAALSSKFGVIVIGVKPAEAPAMHFNPSAETRLNAGDMIVTVGREAKLRELADFLGSPI